MRTRGRQRNRGRMRLGFGIAPAWTPAQLPSLALWLTAVPANCFTDAAGTVQCGDGDLIRVWKDRSGNAANATQASSSLRPTLALSSGKWYIRPDGVDDYMDVAGLTISPAAGITLAAVAKSPSNAAAHDILSQQDGTGTGRSALSANLSSTPTKYGTFLSGTSLQGTTNSPATLSAFVARGQTNLLEVFLNGAADGTAARSPEAASGAYRVATAKLLSNYFSGDIAEIVAVSRAVSNAELSLLSAYFRAKWGTP